MKPKVSVIMGVYMEDLSWLDESISSILEQTFKDFEFIIINDNPERLDLRNKLEAYRKLDNRIRIIENKTNIGLTKSLNRALQIAKGDYIARMDADDISVGDRLYKQVQFLDSHKNCDLVFANIMIFRSENPTSKKIHKIFTSNKMIHRSLLSGNQLVHPIVMIRKASLDKYKIKYNESLKRSQDYGLWLDMALLGFTFSSINEVLLLYRASSNQISQRDSNRQREDACLAFSSSIARYFQNFNMPYKGRFNIEYIESLYQNILKSRPICPIDSRLFVMMFSTIPFSIKKLYAVVLSGVGKYRFDLKDILLSLNFCNKKMERLDVLCLKSTN